MTTLVRHVMTEAPTTLSSSMDAYDAAGIMASYDVGAVPVTDEDGSLLGHDPQEIRLGDMATKTVVSVTPDTQLSQARDLMAEHQIRRLPVLKDEQLVGILSLGDLALATASKRKIGEVLEEVSGSPSTEDRNDGPDQGTPERVSEAR